MIKIIKISTISKFNTWNARFYNNDIFNDTIDYTSLEKNSLTALNDLPEYLYNLLLENIVLSVDKGSTYKTYSKINNIKIEDIVSVQILKLYKETVINKKFPIKIIDQTIKNKIAVLILWSISTLNKDKSIKDLAKKELAKLQQKINQVTTYLEGVL